MPKSARQQAAAKIAANLELIKSLVKECFDLNTEHGDDLFYAENISDIVSDVDPANYDDSWEASDC